MTIDEAIKHCEEVAEENEEQYCNCPMKYKGNYCNNDISAKKCAEEHRQLAEWLRELKTYREFADWLVGAVLEEDWEDSSDFYAEVLCRKLTKLGHLKVEDGKYVEVNADGDSD